MVSGHTGITAGEKGDYQLFNAYKKVLELKNKTAFDKDMANADKLIMHGVLGAINSVTGMDYQTKPNNPLRSKDVNETIDAKYKEETRPQSLAGNVIQGLTTTATLSPLFMLTFATGGVTQGASIGKNMLAAMKGAVPTFAPGGVSKGLQKSVAEVAQRESNGAKIDTYDRIGIFLKNVGGETLKSIMEPVSEVMLPGVSPGSTFFRNVAKKATLGTLVGTGTEQISDITGDLVDGTDTSVLVSLLKNGKIGEEAMTQVLTEAIIGFFDKIGLYLDTIKNRINDNFQRLKFV